MIVVVESQSRLGLPKLIGTFPHLVHFTYLSQTLVCLVIDAFALPSPFVFYTHVVFRRLHICVSLDLKSVCCFCDPFLTMSTSQRQRRSSPEYL